MKTVINLMLILLMTGCSAYKSDPAYDYSSFDGTCGEAGSTGSFKSAFYDSCSNPKDTAKGETYQQLGVNGIMATCEKYLNDLEAADSHLGFFKEEFGTLVVLGTGILGINGSTSTSAFSRIALSTAAINTTVDSIDNNYLLGPNSAGVHDFIKRGLVTLSQDIDDLDGAGFNTTRVRLGELADVCTHKKIRVLINEALLTAKLVTVLKDNEADDVKRAKQNKQLLEIATKVSGTGGLLSSDQLLAAYWITHEAGLKKSKVEDILGEINFDVFTVGLKNELSGLFSNLPADLQTFLAGEVIARKIGGVNAQKTTFVPTIPKRETSITLRVQGSR